MRRRRAVIDPKELDNDATDHIGGTKRFKNTSVQRWFLFLSFPCIVFLIGYHHYHYFQSSSLLSGFGVTEVAVHPPPIPPPLEDKSRNDSSVTKPEVHVEENISGDELDDSDDDQKTITTADDDNDDDNNNNTSSSSIHTKFQWSFLNPFVPGTCGHNKCFFQARDNPTHGYIIAYTTKSNLTLGWERAKMLEEKYGTRHFYLSPPELVPVSKDLFDFAIKNGRKAENKNRFYPKLDPREFLNRTATATATDRDGGLLDADTSVGGGGVVANDGVGGDNILSPAYVFKVQKVRKAPVPFLEWGDREPRKEQCRETFVALNSSIVDREEFVNQLEEEIVDLNETLWREYWLVADFQVIIDQYGLIYHYDLDRNLKSDGNEMSPYFLTRERYILKNLRKIKDGVQGSAMPC